jgi:hypothetical protein
MAHMTTAEVAQVEYTAATIQLDDLARELATVGDAEKSKYTRHAAAIAYRAARAERLNPEPSAVSICGVCHGFLACDWDAHRKLFA